MYSCAMNIRRLLHMNIRRPPQNKVRSSQETKRTNNMGDVLKEVLKEMKNTGAQLGSMNRHLQEWKSSHTVEIDEKLCALKALFRKPCIFH